MTYRLNRPLYDDWGMGQEGQIVTIADPEKAEQLEARGFIARVRSAPENKMLVPPEVKHPEPPPLATVTVQPRPRRRKLT